MNRRKKNISQWSLGLALLLAVGAILVAGGTTLARYRAEFTAPVNFTARPASQICIGKLMPDLLGGDPTFVADAQTGWELEEEQYRLSFALSNIIGEKKYAAEDQQVYLRLLATPGIWDGAETVKITLLMPADEEPEEETTEATNPEENTEPTEKPTEPEPQFEEIPATVTPINPESPLYDIFGDGWVFAFRNEDGTERSWTLEGGKESVLEMTLTLEGAALTDPSLLQLQITAD